MPQILTHSIAHSTTAFGQFAIVKMWHQYSWVWHFNIPINLNLYYNSTNMHDTKIHVCTYIVCVCVCVCRVYKYSALLLYKVHT